METTNLADEQTGAGFKALIYGRSGIGKTALAATLPPGQVLIINEDYGLLSLSPRNQVRMYGTSRDFDIARVTSLEDVSSILDDLESGHPFDSIYFDGITGCGERILQRARKEITDVRQQFGWLFERMSETMRRFMALERPHVFFTALEMYNEKIGLTTAMLAGQSNRRVPAFVDEVFHYGLGKDTDGTPYRRLLTNPTLEYDAKDRSGCLDIEEEPNLAKIIAKIKSK